MDSRLRENAGPATEHEKGPAQSRRVSFIGGIEEAFLVELRLDWRTVRKPEVGLLRVLWPLGRLKY